MRSKAPKILMIAIESGRWGPARLVAPLSAAGFDIMVFCPASNAINQSSHVMEHFNLPYLKSWRRFAQRLGEIVTRCETDLILPCDEQVLAALHFIMRKKSFGRIVISNQLQLLLRRSLGPPSKLDAMILKNETRTLARELGLAVPGGTKVNSAINAVRIADELGFPVFVKNSFSWAGLGTYRCCNAAEVNQAFVKLNPKKTIIKDVIRFFLNMEWYPKYTVTEVQRAAPGKSVMFNVLAWRGRYLGGFFASKEKTIGENGPSSVVKIGANSPCENAARKMVEALEITGFCSFDFMFDEQTNLAVLLECNPRPNQINHLGPKIGIDLCASLALAFSGKFDEISPTVDTATISLFPQEWIRCEQCALTKRSDLDVPMHDPKLLTFMLSEGARIGLSVGKLNLVPLKI